MKKAQIGAASIHILLIVFSLLSLFPFLNMITVAFTPNSYVLPYPPKFFPDSFYLGNFVESLSANRFGHYFLNSVVVAILSTFATLFVASLSAYGFARLDFPGKEILFKFYVFTLMVPAILNIIPQFLVIKSFHLVDTRGGLVLFNVGGAIAGYTFFLRQFFQALPNELEESAVIDGAGRFKIYSRIILPLSGPAMGTMTIFAFTGFWDEFFGALTLIKSEGKRTLPIAIRMFQGQHATDWGFVFAASLIALIPIIVIYIIFQKQFVQAGAVDGAVKE